MKPWTILALLVAIAAVVGIAWGARRERAAEPALTPPAVAVAPAAPNAAPVAAVVVVTSADQLQRLLAAHPGPALIDFHAEWCKPCKELSPRVAELATRRPGLLVMSVDVVAVEAVANAYAAEALPLLVQLEAGKEVARQSGAPTLAELERWLDQPSHP